MATTVITSKGTTTIPQSIREQAGALPGARVEWSFSEGVIRGIVQVDGSNRLQRRIRQLAGTWDGHVSGAELLRRTRP